MKKNIVNQVNKEVAKRAVKQVGKNFDKAQKNAEIIQTGLIIGVPLVIIGVPATMYGIKKYREHKIQKTQTSDTGLLATQYYSHIALAPEPFNWVIPFMSDSKKILSLSETTTDFEATSAAYNTLYNRNFYSDIAKVLSESQYKTFEENIEKSKKSFNVDDYSTNTDAEEGSLVVTIDETKLYPTSEIDKIINSKMPLKNAIYKASIPAKNIISNASFTGVKKSVLKQQGVDNFLNQEQLVEIQIKGGLLKLKKANFYVKNNVVKLTVKKDIKDLNYTVYELPESYLS